MLSCCKKVNFDSVYIYQCASSSSLLLVMELAMPKEVEELKVFFLRFSVSDFKEPAKLISKLRDDKQSSNSVSLFLKGKLSRRFQQQIDEYNDEMELSRELLETLVKEFNKLIEMPLYQQEIFVSINLSEETKRILSTKYNYLKKDDLVRFNRILLEDAYPYEIAKSKDFEKLIYSHQPTVAIFINYFLYKFQIREKYLIMTTFEDIEEQAWESIKGYFTKSDVTKSDVKWKPLIATICHNICVDIFRKLIKKEKTINCKTKQTKEIDTVTQDILVNERNEKIKEAMNMTLSNREKDVISMRFWKSLSYEQIAQQLGTNENNVRTNLLPRSLQKIKKYLQKYYAIED